MRAGEGEEAKDPAPEGRAERSWKDWPRIAEQLARSVGRVCPAWLASQREDIVQAAWVRVAKRLHDDAGGRERDLHAAYFWKVGYTAVVDEIRRRRGEAVRTTSEELLQSLPDRRGEDAERRLGSVELGRGIADCLQRLAPPRRRAVALHLLGHDALEASRLLGFEPKKVRNLVFRGLGDLRACLEAKGLRP